MTTLLIIGSILLWITANYLYCRSLRKERDHLDLTTPTGKLRCREINQILDFNTGFFIWRFLKK